MGIAQLLENRRELTSPRGVINQFEGNVHELAGLNLLRGASQDVSVATVDLVKEPAQFQRITEILSGFSLTLADADDHIVAAEFYNTCRKHGVQGSSIDFLICAMASRRGLSILTTDEDFKRYVKRLPISLH